jgi:hypothetical protein
LAPVRISVTTTFALAIGEPVLSVTLPLNVPRFSCATKTTVETRTKADTTWIFMCETLS